MLKKILCVFLALLIPVLTFSSCKKEDTSDKGFACAVTEMPQHFDPQIAETFDEKMIAVNLFDGLFKLSDTGELQKCAVSDYSVSDDGLSYTFKIKEGLKFFISEKTKKFIENKGGQISDAVTAYDFANGIIRAVLPETDAPDYELLSMIKNAEAVHSGTLSSSELGVRVIDDCTLEITLERASDEFLYALSQPVSFPCKKAFFDLTAGRYGLEPQYIIANGAFYLSSVTEDTSVRILKNTECTGAFAPVPSSVTFYYNSSDDAAGTAENIAKKVDKGTYDCGFFDYTTAKNELGRGVQTVEQENITLALLFNLNKKSMQNLTMRTGLTAAVDIETAVETQAVGLVPPSCRINGKLLDSSSAERIEYNAELARESLIKAFSEEGITNLTVELLCTKAYEKIAKSVVSSWQKNIGVELNGTVKALSSEEYEKALAAGEYDAVLCPVTADSGRAADFLAVFSSDSRENITGYSSEEYDRLVAELQKNPTVEKAVYCQSYLMKNAVAVPLKYENTVFAVAKDVGGIYFCGDRGNVYFYKGEKK